MRRLVAAAGLLALTACTAQQSSTTPAPTPTASDSATPTSTSSELEVTTDLLDWSLVPGDVKVIATVSGEQTLTVSPDAQTATLTGPTPATIKVGTRGRISAALIDGRRAVVVVEDPQASKADRATIIDLASGGQAILDGRSDPPTATGGTWALGQDIVVHASIDPTGAYCLATVSLESGQGSLGWCAPERHGFRGAQITPAGLSVMSFDDQRPASCATLLAIEGVSATPIDDATDCLGWDVALLDGGAIWSEVANPRRVEEADFRASYNGQLHELGPGTTGSLVPCAGSAYFVRDPQTRTDPAQLMRWSPDGTLSVVYESASTGNAFLSAPRCGGETLTMTSYGDQGDEQVSTTLTS